eukprot:466919-Prorocentrum_minimum.AAC.1
MEYKDFVTHFNRIQGEHEKKYPSRELSIKPILSQSTTGEFGSPPKYLRMPHVRVEPQSRPPLDPL